MEEVDLLDQAGEAAGDGERILVVRRVGELLGRARDRERRVAEPEPAAAPGVELPTPDLAEHAPHEQRHELGVEVGRHVVLPLGAPLHLGCEEAHLLLEALRHEDAGRLDPTARPKQVLQELAFRRVPLVHLVVGLHVAVAHLRVRVADTVADEHVDRAGPQTVAAETGLGLPAQLVDPPLHPVGDTTGDDDVDLRQPLHVVQRVDGSNALAAVRVGAQLQGGLDVLGGKSVVAEAPGLHDLRHVLAEDLLSPPLAEEHVDLLDRRVLRQQDAADHGELAHMTDEVVGVPPRCPAASGQHSSSLLSQNVGASGCKLQLGILYQIIYLL